MQVGSHSHAAHHHTAQRNQRTQHAVVPEKPSRGEKIVARLDRDDDGKLSAAELKDTKLGRMSVGRFARLDANEDGKLEAGELDAARRRGRRHHQHANRHRETTMENAVNIRLADYLAEKTTKVDASADVASRLIERLDGDASGALNSEEIAGTRLAEFIGGGFYDLDGDKNGALDKAELATFLIDFLAGGTGAANPRPVAAADDSTDVSEDGAGAIAEEVGLVAAGNQAPAEAANETQGETVDDAANVAAGVSAEPAPANAGTVAPSFSVSQSKAIASAFEAALEILKSGSEAGANPYDVVQALYGDVQKILGS